MKLETVPIKKWCWQVWKPKSFFEWVALIFSGLIFWRVTVGFRYFIDGQEVNGPYVTEKEN